MERISTGKTRVILLDIEGTTTPIDFVHTTLFNYANDNVEAFLQKNSAISEIQLLLGELKSQHDHDLIEGKNPPDWLDADPGSQIKNATSYVRWLIGMDSKTPVLKTLQGLIWEEGYNCGKIKSRVYPDVPQFLKKCEDYGKITCIYSSGSALAQHLIFKETEYGDLTHFISNYFDTSMGKKTDPGSYRNIASFMGIREDQCLFFSDSIQELDAATSAGFKVCWVQKEKTGEHPDSIYPVISSFSEISVE